MQRADVAECIGLLPPWLALSAPQRSALPALWERLVEEPAIITGVQEEMAQPAGQRIQSWGATLVMPSGWYDRLAPGGEFDPPRCTHLCADTYAALLQGTLVPPSERDIGRSNAGEGVVLLALHYRQRVHDLNDPYALRVLNVAHEAFRVDHAGYNIRAFVQQALLSDERWLAVAGFRRCSEPVAGPPEQQTALYRVTRDEAAAMLPGISVRHVFEHQPPRFRLSAAQRRLLWLALFDDSDEPLTQRLAVSAHGLKKLWRGIYERIEDIEPEFFGDATADDDGKRGPEKRRQVLAYVRQRPEELRPWAPG
jgi:hypothetical protein